MKKLIAMAVAILLTGFIAAFATGKSCSAGSKKQFDYQMTFSKIVVANDIDLQLKESEDKTLDITGNAADIEKVDWKIKDDVLYLQSKKGSLKNKVKVMVAVSSLKEIIVKGASSVTSAGPLISPSLYVYLQNDGYVAIKNFGQIYVEYGSYTEVDVRKIVGDVEVGR